MSTFMLKPKEITRKWYVIDASNCSLGRVAAEAAVLLRGKHKVEFTPHVECGDHVVVVNCSKVNLTGNKLTQKHYYRHTGYIGHLKSIRYDALMKDRSDMAMKLAIKGMLPKTSIGRNAMTRLRLYTGNKHEQLAQKPEVWNVRSKTKKQ